MPDQPDMIARVMSAASIVVACVALWLSWRKDARDRAAARPQSGLLVLGTKGRRQWHLRLTVVNPTLVPMYWRKVEAVRPAGLLLSPTDPSDTESPRAVLGGTPYRFLDDGPVLIPPGESRDWEGYAVVDERFGVPEGTVPVIAPVIDGFEPRHSIFRRFRPRSASQIWHDAMSK